MSIHNFYRICFWLPLLLPVLWSGLTSLLRLWIYPGPLLSVGAVFTIWLFYGGAPYAVLALWATWWIGGRPETDIRRMILRAPLVMAATFLPLATVFGFAVGAPGVFLVGGALGAIAIIPLGYGFVGLVMLLREEWGPPAAVR